MYRNAFLLQTRSRSALEDMYALSLADKCFWVDLMRILARQTFRRMAGVVLEVDKILANQQVSFSDLFG
jgi:hypothetical protein